MFVDKNGMHPITKNVFEKKRGFVLKRTIGSDDLKMMHVITNVKQQLIPVTDLKKNVFKI